MPAWLSLSRMVLVYEMVHSTRVMLYQQLGLYFRYPIISISPRQTVIPPEFISEPCSSGTDEVKS